MFTQNSVKHEIDNKIRKMYIEKTRFPADTAKRNLNQLRSLLYRSFKPTDYLFCSHRSCLLSSFVSSVQRSSELKLPNKKHKLTTLIRLYKRYKTLKMKQLQQNETLWPVHKLPPSGQRASEPFDNLARLFESPLLIFPHLFS